MKILTIIALLCLTLLAACSTVRPREPVDENVLVTVPIPGSGWAIRTREGGDESVRMWFKTNETFKILIFHHRIKPEPEQFRSGMDDAARQNLMLAFESKELKKGLVNNYPMVFWQTEATLKNGVKILSLFLYVKGNDATYLVQKRWTDLKISDSEMKTWNDYMLTISVCDNRYPEHKGPKVEEAWPGLYFHRDTTNSVGQ